MGANFMGKVIMEIGDRIKQIRGRTPRAEFAEKLGIHPQTLYLYEKGKRVADVDLIQKICEHFHVSVEWLIFGEGGLQTAGKETPDPELQARLTAQEALLAEREEKINQLTSELIAAQAGALKAYELAMGAMRPASGEVTNNQTTAGRSKVVGNKGE